MFTRRRERISSDEEERRKSGFELEVSFRFADRGGPARLHPRAGRSPTASRCSSSCTPTPPRSGSPTSAAGAARTPPTAGSGWTCARATGCPTSRPPTPPSTPRASDASEDVREKEKVTPYVEDRRNILVVRLTEAVDEQIAVTFRAALERAIEAEFQLEDSELDSKELPDLDDRGRMLLTEAAEGGAGVLARLVDEPDALARVARRALDDHPLRPRHRRGPRPGRRGAGTLRARLLRLPALLRQPVRAQPHRPAHRRARCCAS